MLKKIISLACALALLCSAALADGAATLVGQAVVDEPSIYYAGSLDSAQEGVYFMNTDGSGVSRLADHYMTLLTADGGNLLAVSYDEADYEYALVVLNALGEKVVVYDSYVGNAIAADGRFYWGVASCAVDGSDIRVLIDDDEHSYNYYPVAVSGDWYYYLDWAENSENVLYEDNSYPTAARLCRLNLSTGASDILSGYGARFLGMDESGVYYSRNNYWLYDLEDESAYEAEINSGIFRVDPDTLLTEQITSFPEDDSIYVSYDFLEDGVFYGYLSDFSNGGEIDQIIRTTTDGEELPPLSLDNQSLDILGISNGQLYVSLCSIEFSDDDYIQHDLLYALNLEDGSAALINTPASDLLYYTEMPPAVFVSDERIYMVVLDNSAYAISFKSCALDGSDPVTLARGYSLAEG